MNANRKSEIMFQTVLPTGPGQLANVNPVPCNYRTSANDFKFALYQTSVVLSTVISAKTSGADDAAQNC
jgi:hypothetical protein